MIELEIDKYIVLEELLKEVKINTLFARFVIEKKVKGKVFVDNIDKPKTFYIVHPYGMSLLFGKSDNEIFNNQFADYCFNKKGKRNVFEWMQSYPNEWDDILAKLFSDKLIKATSNEASKELIELNTRVNFRFDYDKYISFKKNNIKEEYKIIPTNKESYKEMKGSVVPANFWNNAEDFCKNGVGFSLFYQQKLATTAYSAFIFDKQLELGMETLPEYRGRGFAQYACSALIDYCLANDYEPIWACRLANIPSYKLAQKLGFVPTLNLPYYRLAL